MAKGINLSPSAHLPFVRFSWPDRPICKYNRLQNIVSAGDSDVRVIIIMVIELSGVQFGL